MIEPLTEEQLNTVYSPILSPLAWDLGHIANFEELWLVQRVGAREPMRGELGRLYDAIENPRKTRNQLPILRGDDLRGYMAEVRARTMDVLDGVELEDTDDEMLAGGFIYEMLIAHEHQHNETMLQLLQMIDGYEPVELDGTVAGEPVTEGPEMVTVPAGSHEVGAAPTASPTTTSVRGTRSSWTPSRSTARRFPTPPSPSSSPRRGPIRRCTGSAKARLGHHGLRPPPSARRRQARRPRDLAPGGRLRPVGRQAPADRVRVGGGRRGRRPRAREPGPARLGCAAAGAYGDAAADCGAVQMLGDVWEWTASDFVGYPASRRFRIPSTPRSSSATPTRCCAAAPGRPGET